MAKMKIEIKKPQYLDAKAAPKVDSKKMNVGPATGLPGIFKFMLFLSYLLFGYAIWQTAQLFIKK